MTKNEREYFTGCLLGGAVGDALGRPVEFDDLEEITSEYGPDGILDMVPGEGGLFEITDDTQMTLFTAEGLLRAWTTARHNGGVPDFAAVVRRSYLCWLKTQGEAANSSNPVIFTDGWLLSIEGLHRRRATGDTCLTALREGSLSENGIAANSSKGCAAGGQPLRGLGFHRIHHRQHSGGVAGRTGHSTRLVEAAGAG